MPKGTRGPRQAGMEPQLPPAPVPRAVHQGVRTHLLQDRAAGHIPARPSETPSGQRMAEPLAGDPHLHPAALRQDHLREPVRRRHPVQRATRRAQHLQHLQAHQSEAASQREEVPRPDLRGAGRGAVSRGPEQLRGARDPGRRVQAGPAHRQQLPFQGDQTQLTRRRASLPTLSCRRCRYETPWTRRPSKQRRA